MLKAMSWKEHVASGVLSLDPCGRTPVKFILVYTWLKPVLPDLAEVSPEAEPEVVQVEMISLARENTGSWVRWRTRHLRLPNIAAAPAADTDWMLRHAGFSINGFLS